MGWNRWENLCYWSWKYPVNGLIIWFSICFCAKFYDAHCEEKCHSFRQKARQMALLYDRSLVFLCGGLQTLHLASKPSDDTRCFLKGQLTFDNLLQILSDVSVFNGFQYIEGVLNNYIHFLVQYVLYDLCMYLVSLWYCRLSSHVFLYASHHHLDCHHILWFKTLCRIGMWIVFNEKMHADSRTALVISEVDLWWSAVHSSNVHPISLHVNIFKSQMRLEIGHPKIPIGHKWWVYPILTHWNPFFMESEREREREGETEMMRKEETERSCTPLSPTARREAIDGLVSYWPIGWWHRIFAPKK